MLFERYLIVFFFLRKWKIIVTVKPLWKNWQSKFFHSMHLRILFEKTECNCQHYINHCIVAAKEQWCDDFIGFKTAVNYFQHFQQNYSEILSENDEKKLLENVYYFFKK